MLRKDIKAWAEPLESSIRVPFIMGAMRLDRWKMIAKFCCSEVGYARYLSLNMQARFNLNVYGINSSFLLQPPSIFHVKMFS